jgi:hypothetical protein
MLEKSSDEGPAFSIVPQSPLAIPIRDACFKISYVIGPLTGILSLTFYHDLGDLDTASRPVS